MMCSLLIFYFDSRSSESALWRSRRGPKASTIALGGAAHFLASVPISPRGKHGVQWYKVVESALGQQTEQRVRPSLNRMIERIFREVPEHEARMIHFEFEKQQYVADIDKIFTDGGEVTLKGMAGEHNREIWMPLKRKVLGKNPQN